MSVPGTCIRRQIAEPTRTAGEESERQSTDLDQAASGRQIARYAMPRRRIPSSIGEEVEGGEHDGGRTPGSTQDIRPGRH
eukprot:857892-Rhodomonas_salina.4